MPVSSFKFQGINACFRFQVSGFRAKVLLWNDELVAFSVYVEDFNVRVGFQVLA